MPQAAQRPILGVFTTKPNNCQYGGKQALKTALKNLSNWQNSGLLLLRHIVYYH